MANESAQLAADLVKMTEVLGEVAEERYRQESKWGQQNHPNGTGPDVWINLDAAGYLRHHGIRAADLSGWATGRTDVAFAHDRGTYEHILTEEWAEALAEDDPVRLRAELIQVAAVAVAWVEKIDRDTLRTPPGGGDRG